MTLVEIVRATGIFGIGLLVGLFLAIFFLASPGKEISFWGIRFHKRRKSPWKWRKWRPIPKKLHPDCEAVLKVFSLLDSYHISDGDLYKLALDMSQMSRVQARDAVIKLERIGILECYGGYCRVLEKGIPIVARMQRERNDTD